MPDLASTFAGLPAPVQTALTWGSGVVTVLLPVMAYLRPGKPKEAAEPAAKTMAVVAPLLDPSQVRQLMDALARMSDGAVVAMRLLGDIKDGQDRTIGALNRVEEGALKAASAAKDVEAAIIRLRT